MDVVGMVKDTVLPLTEKLPCNCALEPEPEAPARIGGHWHDVLGRTEIGEMIAPEALGAMSIFRPPLIQAVVQESTCAEIVSEA